MATGRHDLATLTSDLRSLFDSGVATDLDDAELLERFSRPGNGSAEVAFEILVRRHGPMVLRVCQGTLGDEHDAQDAFQATFLILVRKAGSLRKRASVASWLYGVALRVSADSRSSLARRRKHERRGAEMARKPDCINDAVPLDFGPAVQEEIGRLPERLRAPLILCHMEGLTHDEAARHLRCPVGTVRSRLARARDRLRPRLEKRGLSPSAPLLLAAPSLPSPAEALIQSTVKAAISGTVPDAVATLLEGTMHKFLLMKFSKIAAATLLVGLLAASAYAVTRPEDPPQAKIVAKEAPLPTRAEVRKALKAWWESIETLSFQEQLYGILPDGSPDKSKPFGSVDYAQAPGDRRKVTHNPVKSKEHRQPIQVRLDTGPKSFFVVATGRDLFDRPFVSVSPQTNRRDLYMGEKSASLWLFLFAEGSDSRPLYLFMNEEAPVDISRDAGGKARVILTLKRDGDVPIELDPEHGFLPKHIGGVFRTTVTKFAQENGVWFPVEGKTSSKPGGEVDQSFEIVDLKINRPLPDKQFLPNPEWDKGGFRR